ncbi:hypothetical protein GPECTOR_4g647 [Gonium pectorale]|uniref:Pherophorin domain-containing protein n=1 Tax=Gonium pectorale TaxID=33097 RepID=A0A150GY02_GONPE|nr:hypothetical protein GPECTOR_4g647 [Gonium pectorale]|eukprot:KXZ54582.1 hypothetical protein GPECTOR_4g647 [Gonium pectorale]
MRSRAIFALCGLLLAAAGVRAQLGISGSSGLAFAPRFTRLLKADLSSVASYLLPTEQPALCTSNCCQADSYASPYGLTYLNNTQRQFGGRTYTTFFYQFHSTHRCDNALDNAQCCTASADNIWIDVDPSLKVKYVSFNGQRLVHSEQSEYGLRLGSVNLQVSDAMNGIPVAITVEGAADALCPPPGLAPLPGLCELVVQGATPANPNACCPSTISMNSQLPFQLPEQQFQCSSSLENSPFKLVYDSVTQPVTVSTGQQYVYYNFRLVTTGSCRADSVTDCCNAQLSYMNMKVTDLPITSVQLDGKAVGFTTSTWNEPNSASYRSLIIDNLNLVADDLGSAGLPLIITVRLPSGADSVDLCDSSSDDAQGACSYYLHSEDGFCCPSGLAMPEGGVPPPPPETCPATLMVDPSQTSMSLQYYEKNADASHTIFTFLLANHNPVGGCSKPYCADVCSWTLYLNPEVASMLAVGHENPINNGRQIIVGGNAASVTFPYGPTGESTANFFLTLPGTGKTLSDLCARNAVIGQGSKACAAVVRAASGVYIRVFFNDDEVIIKPGSPPPPVQLCAAPQPMEDSCLRVKSPALFNSMLTWTVFRFTANPVANTAACSPPATANNPATVHVILSAAAVDQLTTRGDVQPKNGLALDRSDGARWTVSTTAATNLTFMLQAADLSVADACRQGVTPEQPANSCVVEVSGNAGCFRGYIKAEKDASIEWVGEQSPSKRGVGASTIVPAVVVPAVVLLLAMVALAAWYRRRRSQRYAYGGDGSDSFSRPLAGGSTAGSMRDDLSVPSASPSDVHIRVPGSQGGAPPSERR